MPNNISNVGFQSPGYDYGADLAQIERSRALAAQLQQHSMEQEPTQSVGGWAIKQSPWSGLAKALQAGAAGYAHKHADQQQRDLSTKAQSDYSAMLARGMQQLQGTPGSAPSADLGGGPAQPAAGPDPAGAMATFGSHPMGAPMIPLAMQEMSRQRLAQALRGGSAPQGPQEAPGMQQAGGMPQGQAPQQPPQQSPTGGPAGGVPMEAWLQADPSGKLYMEQLAKERTPINVRPGGTVYTPGIGPQFYAPNLPQGSVPVDLKQPGAGVQAIPGAQAVQAGNAGATEAGKAPYELSTYNTPGAPTVLTRQQAIQAATGQPMPQPGQPQQPSQQQPTAPQGLPPNVPPQDAAAFQYVKDQAQQGLPARARGNSQYAGPQTPGMRLQDQGESAQQHAGGTEVGKFFGDTYANLQRGAMDASSKLSRLSRMESLLKDVETGKLTPAGTNIAAYAKSLGIDMDPTLDNKQAAEALTNEIALQARNPSGGAGMPGALSNSDRNFLSSMTPGLAKTPGAREMIMDTSRKLAKRDQEVAKLARDYFKNHGNTLDNGFFDELQNFSNANPLFKDGKLPTGGAEIFATNQQTKQRIVSNDGGQTWKPAQ